MEAQTAAPAQACKCLRCGRVLRDARSVARKLGPTCARKMRAAGVELPAVEPSKIVPFVRPKVRHSAAYAGLSYEIETQGSRVFVTFRFGSAFEVVELIGGVAYAVDCSDRHGLPLKVMRHVGEVASKLARAAVPAAL